MCPHSPPCPSASDPDHEAARTLISHPEQGWSLLCNGIVVLPGPHRPHQPPEVNPSGRSRGIGGHRSPPKCHPSAERPF